MHTLTEDFVNRSAWENIFWIGPRCPVTPAGGRLCHCHSPPVWHTVFCRMLWTFRAWRLSRLWANRGRLSGDLFKFLRRPAPLTAATNPSDRGDLLRFRGKLVQCPWRFAAASGLKGPNSQRRRRASGEGLYVRRNALHWSLGNRRLARTKAVGKAEKESSADQSTRKA